MNRALSSIGRMFDDLRRRKVFRAAAAYGVTAWLVVAVADVIVPVLRLPEWTMSLIVLVAIAGLPVAIALSWAFDLSAEGLARSTTDSLAEVEEQRGASAVAYVVIVTMMVVIGYLAWRPFSQAADSGLQAIAVMPFADFSEQGDASYLGDGIAEELLNALVGIEGLRVAARTSSFAFKGVNEDIRSIGQKLNVDTVLEGSVRRFGGRVRITAQLIKVSDGFHLWSKTYDRELNDIFAIQHEIASAIADALKMELGTGEDRPTMRHAGTTFEAYDLYLLGRHHWHRRTPASLQRAVELFREAAAADPGFALAYSGLADAFLLLRDYGDLDEETAQRQAEAAIARALQLDDRLAEPYASLGLLRLSRNELTGAELAFRNAIELDPSYSMAHMWLGLVLDSTQGPGAAFEEYRAAHRSDPLHPVINGNLAGALARMGRYEEARGYLRRSEAANPDTGSLRTHLAWLDSYYGRFDESVGWALRAGEGVEDGKPRRLLAASFAMMGDTPRALSYLGDADPLNESTFEFDTRALVLYAGGEYSRLHELARARLARADSLDGHGGGVHELAWAGIARIAQSDYDGAIADLEAVLGKAMPRDLDAPRRITLLGLLAHAYDRTGDTARRDELIASSLAVYEKERGRGWASPAFGAAIAGTYALQGERQRALDELAAAAEKGWRDYRWLHADPRFAALRGDPAYEARLAGMRNELDAMLKRASDLVDEQLAARLD